MFTMFKNARICKYIFLFFVKNIYVNKTRGYGQGLKAEKFDKKKVFLLH